MPEGDTVYRAARSLDRALAGQVLTATSFRVPQLATVDLAGATVLRTLSRGKHLLTRIEADEAWTLHTHLKMEGAWQVYPPGQRWRRPTHEARVVLSTESKVAVGFSLGIVELVPRHREHDVVGHLGPDLLGHDWDEAEALRRLLAAPERTTDEALLDQTCLDGASLRLTTSRTIGEALLDQRCLAGLGTVYVSETLFLAGVSPLTHVTQVPDLGKVVRLAHRLLTFNKDRSIQVTTGNTRKGEQHYVYLRTGEPCRRCGRTIESGLVGPVAKERRTYWCPSCQPSP